MDSAVSAPARPVSQILFRLWDRGLLALFRLMGGRRPRRGLLLVVSGGIGDAILFSVAAPQFAALAEAGEPVVLVTPPSSAALDFLMPPGFTLWPVDYRRFRRNAFYRARIGWALFGLGARRAIATDYLRHPLVDDAVVFFSDAPERIGLDPKPWPKYSGLLRANLGHYTRIVPVSHAPLHKFVRWLHLPAALSGRDLMVPPVRREMARPVVPTAERVVVIHPFASTRARQPSAAWFAGLLAQLPAEYRLVLSCGPGDLERNPDFAALAAGPRLSLDTGSLADKAAALAVATLVITVDTSILHLAALVGAPVICVAASAHVVDSVPYDPRMNAGNVRFIVGPCDDAGCLGKCTRPLVGDRYPCLDGISVETVAQAMLEVLGRISRGQP